MLSGNQPERSDGVNYIQNTDSDNQVAGMINAIICRVWGCDKSFPSFDYNSWS